ncbi:MAG: thermonuclease family protein [Litoreibacter sp.]|nr:thermonuclease family protein [Litoreibacter sp.]
MLRVALLSLILLAEPALADFSGRTRVIDGDTFDVGKVRVRVFGIDAPEADQTCTTKAGVQWACGAWVSSEVRARYDGRLLRCVTRDEDQYGRVVASCKDQQGQDIGARLVEDGLAMAYRRYSNRYALAEKAAAVAERGLWGSAFQNPAEFRKSRSQGGPPPNEDCVIKGNISGSGRIYHRPGNRDYERTVISPSKGERWFCSEAEARAAGWRPAGN